MSASVVYVRSLLSHISTFLGLFRIILYLSTIWLFSSDPPTPICPSNHLLPLSWAPPPISPPTPHISHHRSAVSSAVAHVVVIPACSPASRPCKPNHYFCISYSSLTVTMIWTHMQNSALFLLLRFVSFPAKKKRKQSEQLMTLFVVWHCNCTNDSKWMW